jgi:hypothetical protein
MLFTSELLLSLSRLLADDLHTFTPQVYAAVNVDVRKRALLLLQ